MKYLKFKTPQIIEMTNKTDCVIHSVIEAINICKKQDIEIDLFFKQKGYNQFLFCIDKDSDLKQKISDYNYFIKIQKS